MFERSLRGNSLVLVVSTPINPHPREKDAGTLIVQVDWSEINSTLIAIVEEWTEGAAERWVALVQDDQTVVASSRPELLIPGEKFSSEGVGGRFWEQAADLRLAPWTLRAFESEELALQPLRSLERLLFVVSSIIMAGALALAIGLSRWLGQRLAESQGTLREAAQKAEAASRAKSEFLANVGHELRTPMNGVMGGIEFLLETALNPGQRKWAEIVHASGEAQLAVVNDILDFSTIDAGMLTIEPCPFDLHVAVEEVMTLVMAEAEKKGIQLAVRYAPDSPRRVIGDAGRIRQVLTNLVGNAVKFTEKGHVVVTVTSEEQGDEAARFRVTVEDTGIGVPEDKTSHIFEKFTQADSSSTRRFEGTGLGLSISKQLVVLMGGQIGVTSRPGEGSTFWFALDLPLDAQPPGTRQPVAEVPSTVQATHTTATTQPIGTRVLVAEDNVVNQKVAVRMLEKLGCRVDVAATGKDAVHMVTRFPYDLVFMDCLMPEMDGFEATGQIRRLEGRKQHIPIIAMTALAMKGDSGRCLAAGMNDYLSKPVKLEGLQAALERWGQAATSPCERELGEASLPADPTGNSHADENASPALDPAALAQLGELAPDGDESGLHELFSSFLDNATATIEMLRQAARIGDARGLTRAAHSLRGSSRNVGARSLADICERLEALGKAESLAGASECINQLEQEFGRVKGSLAT